MSNGTAPRLRPDTRRGPGSITSASRGARRYAAFRREVGTASGMSSAVSNWYQDAFLLARCTVHSIVASSRGELAHDPPLGVESEDAEARRLTLHRSARVLVAAGRDRQSARDLGSEVVLVGAVADARDADRGMDRGPDDAPAPARWRRAPAHAGGGSPPSIASSAELAPAFSRSRRESGRLRVAAHRSTTSLISTSDSAGTTPTLGGIPARVQLACARWKPRSSQQVSVFEPWSPRRMSRHTPWPRGRCRSPFADTT